MPQTRVPTITRFLSKVQQPDDPAGCWTWTGAKDKDGYGIFWDGTYRENGAGHYVRVTRWAFEQFVGPIEAGLNVCHSCDKPPCCNPAHLFLGTHKQNHEDRERKGRGRRAHGSEHVGAKLDEFMVRTMRNWAAEGISQKQLAQEFGVSNQLVSMIVRRKVWTHVD